MLTNATSRLREEDPVTRTRRVCIAALATGAALTLAACGGAEEIGAAAVVGNERISVNDLQDQVISYAESLPDAPPPTGDTTALQQAVLERMVRHQLFRELAEREGVTVTEADIDRFLTDFAAQQGGDLTAFYAQNGFTEESVRDVVHDELVRQQLVERLGSDEEVFAALTELSDEVGVTVNPRYGRWDGSALERVTGSISEATGDEAAATGATPQG